MTNRLARARWIAPLAIGLIAACASRGLSPGERAFTESVLGPELDAGEVRIVEGAAVGFLTATFAPRPRITCRERIWPQQTKPITGRYGAMVLDETIYYTRVNWQDDFLADYPQGMNLPQAMRLVHELTHIWQWQQRELTGYHPLKAAREHIQFDDPYLIDIDTERPFLDYPYEQQAVLVEEFVCCRALDPEGARTEALHDVIQQVFPAATRFSAVPQDGVFLPWREAEREGICS